MNNYSTTNTKLISWSLLIGVLLICLAYSLEYIRRPYIGIVWIGTQTGWEVETVDCVSKCLLRAGDTIIQVGDITFATALADRRLVPFERYKSDDVIKLKVDRKGTLSTVEWLIPTAKSQWRFAQGIIVLFFSPFLVMAFVMLRWSQPMDRSWWLMFLTFLGYALWIASGTVSPTLLGYSSLVMHALTWLLAPLLIHFHWHIPSPLQSKFLPNWSIFYGLGSVFALLELWQLLPRPLFLLGSVASILLSLSILFYRVYRTTSGDLRTVQVMFLGLITTFSPGTTWALMSLFTSEPPDAALSVAATVSLSALPFFYWYGTYYKKIGHAEPKIRSVAVSIVFIVIMTNIMSVVVVFLGRIFGWDSQVLQYNILLVVFINTSSVLSYNLIRHWFGRYLFKEGMIDIDSTASWFSSKLPKGINGDLPTILDEVTTRLTLTDSVLWSNDGVVHYYKRFPLGKEKPAWVCLDIPFAVGQVSGHWWLGSKAGDDYFSIYERQRLTRLAQQIGALLEIRRLYAVQEMEARQQQQLMADGLRQERVDSLWRLAYDVAHTLRTPLMNVLLNLELIRDYPDHKEMPTWIDLALDQTTQTSSLLNEMLILVKAYETEHVSLDHILSRALDLIRGLATEQQITINYHIQKSLMVLGVESRLIVAFKNLLQNGIQAMPNGGQLTIQSKGYNGTVEVKISDTGIGIDPEKIGKIFDPFYTTKAQGTGWGLAQSYAIVEQHKGHIQVQSKEQSGTVFTVSLPGSTNP